jgi:hypothetical protein
MVVQNKVVLLYQVSGKQQQSLLALMLEKHGYH